MIRPQQSGIECVTRMGVTSKGPMRVGWRILISRKLRVSNGFLCFVFVLVFVLVLVFVFGAGGGARGVLSAQASPLFVLPPFPPFRNNENPQHSKTTQRTKQPTASGRTGCTPACAGPPAAARTSRRKSASTGRARAAPRAARRCGPRARASAPGPRSCRATGPGRRCRGGSSACRGPGS